MRTKGDFLQAEVADFALHFAVGSVEFYAEAGSFEAFFDGLGVFQMLFADGNKAYLDGSEPHGEGAGVVLDEDAEEAFYRAEESAVDHNGLGGVRRPAPMYSRLKPLREVPVKLDGGELPEAAQDVDELDVDFGGRRKRLRREWFCRGCSCDRGRG